MQNYEMFRLLDMASNDFDAGARQVPRTDEEQTILNAIIAIQACKEVSRHTLGNYVTMLRANRCLSATDGHPEKHCLQPGCPFAEVHS